MSAFARLPAKTTIGGVNLPLSPLTPLLSAPWPQCQFQAVIKELFYSKNQGSNWRWGPADLHERSVPHKAFSDDLAARDITL